MPDLGRVGPGGLSRSRCKICWMRPDLTFEMPPGRIASSTASRGASRTASHVGRRARRRRYATSRLRSLVLCESTVNTTSANGSPCGAIRGTPYTARSRSRTARTRRRRGRGPRVRAPRHGTPRICSHAVRHAREHTSHARGAAGLLAQRAAAHDGGPVTRARCRTCTGRTTNPEDWVGSPERSARSPQSGGGGRAPWTHPRRGCRRESGVPRAHAAGSRPTSPALGAPASLGTSTTRSPATCASSSSTSTSWRC